MGITDIPILSRLRARMAWHMARQRVLAENVANADTAGYRPRDLAPPDFTSALQQAPLALARTHPGDLAGLSPAAGFASRHSLRYDVQPDGNGVNREDEMMQIASNQMDYETVAQLYVRSLALIKLAAGAS
jgi:flagellar basal-body rod protein FlgB